MIAELNPDEILAGLLDNKVTVQISETEKYPVRCYADNKMPATGLADEFLSILLNGPIRSRTQRPGLFKGSLGLAVCCRLYSDGTANMQRIRQMITQCERAAQDRCVKGFIFRIDPTKVITPTTPNLVTGYSTTVINIEWRTI